MKPDNFFEHVMLDLETLDTCSSAVVLSIGAVAFDPFSRVIGEKFYVELVDDIAAQQRAGRTISGDTVRWWMDQNESAKLLFSKDPIQTDPKAKVANRTSTELALKAFSAFIQRANGKECKVWGNGADFDNVVLGTLYEDFGLPKPWSYSKNRCYRTVMDLTRMSAFKNAPVLPKRQGVYHNALDDALTQAARLQEIMKWLAHA